MQGVKALEGVVSGHGEEGKVKQKRVCIMYSYVVK